MTAGVGQTQVAAQRQKIAGRMIAGAFFVIGVSGAVLIGGLIWFMLEVVQRSGGRPVEPDQFQFVFVHIDRFISAILPLFGAWVGAVIAFYFARDNFDAATENTRALLGQMGVVDLETISAKSTMIPRGDLTVATVGTDDAKLVETEILPRFKGRGRIIVLGAGDEGVGVLHDSYVTKFLYDGHGRLGKPGAQITFGEMITHADTRTQLGDSVVFVRPSDTLAAVRNAMREAGRKGSISVRDCFVTQNGRSDEPILGYLSEIDIANKAKLAG